MQALHPHARASLIRWLVFFIVLATGIALVVWWRDNRAAAPSAIRTQQTAVNSQTSSFDKKRYSLNDPTSLWVVVNKGRVLPSGFVPAHLVVPRVVLSEGSAAENMQLRSEAAAALEKLNTAASADGVGLMLVSGYRSYSTQQTVYSGYANSQGQGYADSTSARPGHSEHQTGLAADLGSTTGKCQLDKCFGDLVEGKWLADNAYKYGFIIRYQKDKTSLTGYDYEPWHLRYVGTDLAAEINKAGQTLEQFFALPAYTDYPAQMVELM